VEGKMSKKQAEQIAREFVQAHRDHLAASPEAIEQAVKKVAGALVGLAAK
jgi:hypothetical protein